jgi:hypothetical protein
VPKSSSLKLAWPRWHAHALAVLAGTTVAYVLVAHLMLSGKGMIAVPLLFVVPPMVLGVTSAFYALVFLPIFMLTAHFFPQVRVATIPLTTFGIFIVVGAVSGGNIPATLASCAVGGTCAAVLVLLRARESSREEVRP